MTNNNNKKAQSTANQHWSAKDLCQELQKLSKETKWNKSIAKRFVDLTIKLKEQGLVLDDGQRKSAIDSIKNCPEDYQALVILKIVVKNFVSSAKTETLDNIIPEIINFIVEDKLKLKAYDKGELPKLEKNNLVDWLEKELSSIDKKEKLDFIRYFFVYSIATKKIPKLTSNELSIAELLSDNKSSIIEVERLIRFEINNQTLISQQTQKITQLDASLVKEQKISSQRKHKIDELESHCQTLKQNLEKTNTKLEEVKTTLEQEKILYDQLKSSSTAKISQQRNSALSQVKSRLDHELDKLERFFNSDSDSFQTNRRLGLKIINKIREQLSISDNI